MSVGDEFRYITTRQFCEHGMTTEHPVTFVAERSWCPGPFVDLPRPPVGGGGSHDRTE